VESVLTIATRYKVPEDSVLRPYKISLYEEANQR
jgi:hypothetical protein